jgi:hypothetical protein
MRSLPDALGRAARSTRPSPFIALAGLSLLSSCGNALAVETGGNRIAAADDLIIRYPLAAAPAGHKVMRDRRIALSALAGTAFGRPSQPSLLYGGEALFHPLNELGVGLWGVGASPLRGEGSPGALRAVLSPEAVFVPLYGRGDLFEQLWFAYDLHFEVGGAWIQVDGRPMGTLPSPTAGVGLLTFWRAWGLAHWSLGIDYRRLLDGPPQMVVLSLGLWPQQARWDDE